MSRAEQEGRRPPLGEMLFARNAETGTVHILCHVPERHEPGWSPAREYASFAEGLADMFNTPSWMLCGIRLLVCAGDGPAVWIAGDDFEDGDLCGRCVRALGQQQWQAFHVDNRGSSAEPEPQEAAGEYPSWVAKR